MTEQKLLIYDLSQEALTNWFAQQKQPAYRAKQVWSAIYQQFINHPDEISTLSKHCENNCRTLLTSSPSIPSERLNPPMGKPSRRSSNCGMDSTSKPS